MTTHLEDRSKSGITRKPYTLEFAYRYAALCDQTFYDGDPKHRLADPDTKPTCTICDAVSAEHAITKRSPNV